MKRLLSILMFFLFLPSLYAASYVLEVAPKIEGILQINNKAPIKITSTDALRKKYFSIPIYSEGILFSRKKTEKGTAENTCHITFVKNSTWIVQSFAGDQCKFLQNKSDNRIIINPPLLEKTTTPSSRFAPLNPHRVYLVDYQATKGGNLFFRGNNPFTKGFNQQVDFQKLFDTMQKKFHQQVPNATFPKSFEFIDISILSRNPYGEDIIVRKEANSFGNKNPLVNVITPAIKKMATPISVPNRQVTGRFLSWPVEATDLKITATNQTSSNIQAALQAAHTPPLQNLIEKMHRWMNTKHDVPVILYVHCLNGQDRTSDVVVSYLLRQYKMPLSKTYIEGTTLLKNHQKIRFLPISKNFHTAMRWYCAYLKHNGYKIKGNCLEPFNKTKIINRYPWEQ